MWGNRLGWSISAAIVVLYGAALVMFARTANTRSAPTEFAAQSGAGQPLQLPVPPGAVLDRMTQAGDAARFYRLAIQTYHANRRTYETFAERGRPGTPEAAALDAVPLVIEATPIASMNLFTSRPDELIRYGRSEDLEALRQLGHIMAVRYGLLLEKQNKPQEAMQYYEAVFSLGARLYEERLTYPELELGISLMGLVAERMQKLAKELGDNERAATIERFEAGRRQFYAERVQPMARVLRSVDPGVVGRHSGDVFHFAEHALERMWRVEAILALGRMRFFVGEGGTLGNQRGASQLLRGLAKDPDPIIRQAAKAALELTVEQYRTLG